MISKYKNILIGIGGVIALFPLYSFFFTSDVPDEGLIVSETATSTAAGEELLALLLELRSIDLSTDLFADRTFATLEDFTVELAPEPIGRRNPFAAIGTAVGVQRLPTASATSSARTATSSPSLPRAATSSAPAVSQ